MRPDEIADILDRAARCALAVDAEPASSDQIGQLAGLLAEAGDSAQDILGLDRYARLTGPKADWWIEWYRRDATKPKAGQGFVIRSVQPTVETLVGHSDAGPPERSLMFCADVPASRKHELWWTTDRGKARIFPTRAKAQAALERGLETYDDLRYAQLKVVEA